MRGSRRWPTAAMVAALAACTRQTPEPTSPSDASPPPVPKPGPTITGPSVLYQRVSPSHYGSDAYLLSFGTDSAFVIVFPGGVSYWDWSGRYYRAEGDSVLDFTYKGSSGSALGTLRGDTLVLKYDIVMSDTGFEDGVYVKARVTP